MSLFGALFAGVSGLRSQSVAMSAIADNVTNVNTIGYKGTQVNFKTLMTVETSLTQYTGVGVQSSPRQNVDIQGLLQATTSSTDVAISGSGFFVTSSVADVGSHDLFTYTRAGQFNVDDEGYLENVGGGYMQGWPLTFYDGSETASTVKSGEDIFMKAYIQENGDKKIINDNVIDNRNLRPLNLSTIGGLAAPTTSMALGANLPAQAKIDHNERVNALIFDSLGTPHNISYNFTKIAANEWASTVEQPAQSAVVTQKTQKGEVYYAGGRIDFMSEAQLPISGNLIFQVHGTDFQILLNNDPSAVDDDLTTVATADRTMSQVLDELAQVINANMIAAYGGAGIGDAPTVPGNWARRISGENGITFDNVSPTLAMTFQVDPANPIKDNAGKQIVYQNKSAGYIVPALDSGERDSGVIGEVTLAWYDLSGSNYDPATGAPAARPQRGAPAVKFAGHGVPAEFFGRHPSEAPSPMFTVELVWANGAEDMRAENMLEGNPRSPAIETFFGNYHTPDGLTQMSGDFQLNSLQQNGAKFGNFSGVTIGEDGIVTALFDNGIRRPVFMIPLANFTNPSGLQSLSGNSWIESDYSGSPMLREAGSAGTGFINAAALESSTVDLSTEFTRMITTQRAYSSAAKIITTADEMLNELLNIKR